MWNYKLNDPSTFSNHVVRNWNWMAQIEKVLFLHRAFPMSKQETIFFSIIGHQRNPIFEKWFPSLRTISWRWTVIATLFLYLELYNNVNPFTYKRTKSWSHVRGPQRSLTPAAWATSTREKYGQLLQHKGPIHYLQEMMIKLHQRTFISFNKCNIAFLSGPKNIFQTCTK